jgi:glycosyltransferase involved in cell wall biosynthesis
MPSQRLRIAIDARYLSHGLVGGVHTYLRNLASALIELDSSHEYTFWVDDKAPFELADDHPDARTRVLPWRAPLSSLRNDLRLGMLMRRDGADVVHFPANYGYAPPGVPTVVTLHDAINILPLSEIVGGHPKQARTIATMTYLHLATRRAIARRPFVITVSQQARREILRHADLDPDQVRVIYHAPEPVFQPLAEHEIASERARLGLHDLVLVADAIKNPKVTLNAYRGLPRELREHTSLVFFARREPEQSVIRAHLAGECLLVRSPAKNELARLYGIADGFVFPSWYEGFGLPVLEAMACGTPVAASCVGAVPELVEDAGLVIGNANDDRAFSRALAQLLSGSEYRRELRAQALRRAQMFTWRRAALETHEAYADALEAARPRSRRRSALHEPALN